MNADEMDKERFHRRGRGDRREEDGSMGKRGFVTSEVAQAVTSKADGVVIAVACGPLSMLQSLKRQLADTDVQLYVSLEGRMACGIGLCKGCAVKAAPPGEGYFHVCVDGPVFRARDVLMEEEN